MENPKGYIIIGVVMVAMLGWFFLRPDPKVVLRSSEYNATKMATDNKSETENPNKTLSEKEAETLDDIEGLTVALIIFSEAHDAVIPDSLDDLVGAVHPDTKMIYLKNYQTLDAWGNPFRIEKSEPQGDYGQKFIIISDGQDEEPGTPDDLTTSEVDMLGLSMTRSYMESQRNK